MDATSTFIYFGKLGMGSDFKISENVTSVGGLI